MRTFGIRCPAIHAGVEPVQAVGVHAGEPGRERQCETYQERLTSLLRQHHVDGLDIFNNWTKDDAWERRFLLDSAGSAKLYGPVPNAAAREELAKMLKDKL